MTTAREYARRILKCAPLAIRATKHCALQGLKYSSSQDAMAAQLGGEFPLLDAMMRSDDTQEGLNAFLEKRKPDWQAR